MTWTSEHTFPDEKTEARWRAFLSRGDYPAHYVSPEYFKDPFLRDKDPFAVLAWQDDGVVGVVTGVREGNQLTCGLMSRPQICLDESVDKSISSRSLIEGLLQEAGSAQLIKVFTWSELDTFVEQEYQMKEEEGVVMLDLTLGAETLFKGFAGTRRTDVRNAIKRGVEVIIATTQEEFRAYFEIYSAWCERKNIESASFETIEEALTCSDNRKLFLAKYQDEIMAGTIIRCYPGEMIEYAANSSVPESLKLRPNDLLQWRVVEWACQQGFKRYSLGGAHLFSRRMGGAIAPIYRYRLDRTWLRRHELKDALGQSSRKVFNALPEGVRNQVKRTLKGEE